MQPEAARALIHIDFVLLSLCDVEHVHASALQAYLTHDLLLPLYQLVMRIATHGGAICEFILIYHLLRQLGEEPNRSLVGLVRRAVCQDGLEAIHESSGLVDVLEIDDGLDLILHHVLLF